MIGHEKPSFPGASCSVHRERNEQHESKRNQPLMVLVPERLLSAAQLVRSDDEQTKHDKQYDKTMLHNDATKNDTMKD